VLSTLCHAADLGYGLTVLSDGCPDPDPALPAVLVEKVFARHAGIATIADRVRDIRAR
jgi:hypothetical protein